MLVNSVQVSITVKLQVKTAWVLEAAEGFSASHTTMYLFRAAMFLLKLFIALTVIVSAHAAYSVYGIT